jgi:drug/metabolite transporter (DMT)-like permease
MNKNTLILLIVFAMISWGGAWPSAKSITKDTELIVTIFWRFSLTFVSFVPVFFFFKPKKILWRWDNIKWGILGGVIYYIYTKFFFWGLDLGNPGSGGVLVTTLNPILTFFLTLIWQRSPIHFFGYLSIVFGLIGCIFLLDIPSQGFNGIFMFGNIFFVACSITWASLTFITKKSSDQLDHFSFTFLVYGIGLLLVVLIEKPFLRENFIPNNINYWIQIFYLSVISTTFGTTAYFYISSILGPRRASSFIFIVPTAALLLSWIFMNEIPKLNTILGGIFSIIAVYLSQMQVSFEKN